MKFSKLVVLGAALSTTAVLAADTASSSKSANAQNPSDMKTVKIKDITKSPQKWMNKKVMIEGKVDRVFSSSNAFVLDGTGFFNDQILVITQSGAAAKGQSGMNGAGAENTTAGSGTTTAGSGTTTAGSGTTTAGSGATTAGTSSSLSLSEDQKVQVMGTVRRMNIVQIEREYGLDLDPQLKIEFEGTMPVLVSDASNLKMMSAE